MSIELMDSFEQKILTKYVSGSLSFVNTGRGSSHRGAVSIDVGGNDHVLAVVSSTSAKGQAVAINVASLAVTPIFVFNESSGSITHVTVGFDATGRVAAWLGTTSGTLLGTSTGVIASPGSFVHIEAKVTVNNTTGAVEVRANESAVLTLSGIDTQNGGTGVIDQVGLSASPNPAPLFTVFDDYVVWNTSGSVNNDFLGDVRVGYSAANVAGTHTDGTATGDATLLACVDDIGYDGDATYINFDNTALPKAASFGVEDAPTNATAILAVAPIAIVRKDDAGTDNGRLLLISGATEEDGGSDIAATSGYKLLIRIDETDPHTTLAWTISNFNAIEVGWRRTA